MSNIDILIATKEISDLKAKYFRFVDTRRWDDLQALFTADATLFFPESGQKQPTGVSDSMTFIKKMLHDTVTIHMGHTPEIEFDSPTTARGIWCMEDHIYWSSQAAAEIGLESLHGYGHYHEDYVRVNGRWLIRNLKLTRLRLERTYAPQTVA